MLTRKMRFEEGRLLFINANAAEGFVRAQIEDEAGRPISGYSFADCVPMIADSTKRQLVFRGGDLSALRGRVFRIRFELIAADLFAFWIAGDEQGHSGGYVAAGGSAYPGPKDE